MRLSRRQTLVGLSLGAAGTLAAGVGIGSLAWHPATTRFSERLLQLLPDIQLAARIGAAWQQRHSAFFDSPDVLPARLAARLQRYGWVAEETDADAGDAHLQAIVATLVRDEFKRGEVEDVRGWRISAFQAELCGLAYLVRSQPRSV